MDTFKNFESRLYSVNDSSFEDIALDLFRFQARNNDIYKRFITHLGLQADKIHSLQSIPYLPISFFKHHAVKTGSWNTETLFASSGTAGATTSTHHIKDLQFYRKHSVKCFEHFFGDIRDYHFLALLPSYLERDNSSLVAMIDFFIRQSGSPHSGFYLNNIPELLSDLEKLKNTGRKTILWGVTFALLDLAETIRPDLSHCIVFETGGMKGRRKEITRQELHEVLKQGLNVPKVYSEYGMTELLSQSYSKGHDRFYCSPWKKIIGRDLSDPLEKGLQNETAGINVVDLANWHSVAFIETEDLGKVSDDGSFEVLGRMDNSDIRGCNLLAG
ncbi:acyl transferase [Fulvivirgaceae bacterium PWU4]|uniref:Acyl transferase n=1 Tax=Chryseosolibacter histidini TaxID=2782349 RepID=A0AAP2DGF6_9BACT|nr:acyl transferase [Chryseosolibacter histidini]MBT1695840.1 acyl transferase [Chryseosolibacter histidini]